MDQVLKSKQINFLNKYTIGSWRVNPSNGLIDIQGDFVYSIDSRTPYRAVLYPLRGLRFGEVTGDFIFEAQPSNIDDLEGFPQKVGGDFSCSRCNIKSLKGGPIEVGGSYNCSFNNLRNFEYVPERINGDFICRFNRSETLSLKYLPGYIKGDLDLRDGYPWDRILDKENVEIFEKIIPGIVSGSVRMDSAYSAFDTGIIKPLAIPGTSLSSLRKILIKRKII